MNIEAVKSLNLVDFLSEHYGLEFKRSRQGYICRSPFSVDRKPSFLVRLVEGHWLFKDFSSGAGGSIIDLVRQIEKLADISSVLKRIEQLTGGIYSQNKEDVSSAPSAESEQGSHAYDINALYAQFREHPTEPCREYLFDRGIKENLVEELIAQGEVVHNFYKGRSYCCFAVHDNRGRLKCLDNHEIGGSGKFVLGQKSMFSRDWQSLPTAAEVFISEGIIDYLSIKTLENDLFPGLALLGNQLLFDAAILSECKHIIAAVDEDKGGSSALYDLIELYPDKEITAYDLQGYKDPNELLQAGRSKGKHQRRLSAADKLELYEQFQQADNKAELARQWGIDRSHMYQLIRDCKELLLSGLSGRSAGRKPSGQPDTVEGAWQQIKELQEKNKRLTIERDTLHCREELMGIRLKWAEIEAAELRNEPVDEKTGPKRKSQIKKKKKKRRLR